MPTTIEKICRTCKFPFSFPASEATFPCPACGAVNGRPQAEGMSYDCLKRATRQRLACDFHNAEVSYQHVLLEYEEEHEALWGLALCRYGVEYVQDTKTGKLMPTVHSIRKKPMQADSDFLAACEYAPEELRARYEAEAAYIDDAMTGVRKLAETQQPYDVFICHKKTVPGSENLTPEYGKAAEMAHHLEKQGYRVFFAPEAIKSELGADYEAAIYHALDTAKVMLMFCSNVEYVTSAWVRSEWTRFLEMATEREDKRLVPLLYGDFTPAKLPRELRPYRLECVTMDSFTAASDILRLLEKCCGKRGTQEAAPEPEKPVQEKKPAQAKKPAPAKPAQEKPAEAKTTAPKKPAPARPAAEKKPAPAKKPMPAPVPAKPAPIYTPESDFEIAPVKGGCSITKYRGKGGNVSVPPTIGGQKVVEIGKAAFEKCKSLTGVTLPEGVQWIQNGAFSQCDKLAEVTLPGSLKRIDCNAFSHCVALKSVTLPDRLTILEHAAFSYSGLVSVKLPDSLKKVEGNPFWQCGQLTHIQLSPAHLCLEVRDGALMDKTEKKLICYPAGLNADHYRVPEDIRIIELGAFGGCVHLKNVTLPEGLRTIEGAAFSDCSGLRSMSIPDSVREIGLHAFNGCTALTNVTLPEAADVNDKAFGWCDNLKPENIVRRPKAGAVKAVPTKTAAEKKPAPTPAKPASIYTSESDFETAPVAGGCSITKYKGQGGRVNVPPTIGGLEVVKIGMSAFSDCTGLTGVTLPEGVTSIEDWAFWCCSNLTSITLPKLLKSIGRSAFWKCSSLTSIALPNGVTSIGESAFWECSRLKSIMLPESLTSIETAAFAYCDSMTSITLPEGLTSLGSGAFDFCSSLTSVVLPGSLREIGERVFRGCNSLPLSQKLKFTLKGLM